jgi:5-methylcytosine-specific restriction endonuclease McrA
VSGFSFSHLSPDEVMRGYSQAKASNRASDALLLAYLADIDARKIFLETEHNSMYAFVIAEFDLTHDAANNRIREARTARQFPEIFTMLSDGRLRKRTILLLAPHLRAANASELLNAVAGKTKTEVEKLLAARFPRSELLSWTMGPAAKSSSSDSPALDVQPGSSPLEIDSASPSAARPDTTTGGDSRTDPEQNSEIELVPGRVGMTTPATTTPGTTSPAEPRIAPASAPSPTPPATRVTPIAAHAYGVQFMMDEDAHDDLEYLRAVLGHEAPTIAQVLARALKALRREVDKRKFAATDRPRKPRSAPAARSVPTTATSTTSDTAPSITPNPRRIPKHIRRAVSMRDQYRCAFVGQNGRRCDARAGLELDHIVPVARGGQSTVDNLRLLCRAHNQHAADRTFGVDFMERKRSNAKRAPARTPSPVTRLSAEPSWRITE